MPDVGGTAPANNPEEPPSSRVEGAAPSLLPDSVPSDPDNSSSETHSNGHPIDRLHERLSSFERATLQWTRLTVVVSIVAACFVCLQWWEMHTGGRDTHDLAEQAKNQADATLAVANSAASQARETAELAQAASRQERDTLALAESSKEQIDIMQRQLELGDRPWIKISSATLDEYAWNDMRDLGLNLNLYLSYNLRVVNAGKSAALDVALDSELYIEDSTTIGGHAKTDLSSSVPDLQKELSRFCDDPKRHIHHDPLQSPLFPDGEEQYHYQKLSFEFPRNDEIRLLGESIRTYVLGCVDYHFLASSKTHSTRFVYLVAEDSEKDDAISDHLNIFASDQLPFAVSHPEWHYILRAIPRAKQSN